MNLIGAVVIIGLNIAAYLLNKPQQRAPTRKEKFELPRTEEGEHLPIVIGIGEIAPNFVWSGNIKQKIIDTDSGPRTLYYANAIGSICHGPATTLIDVIWEDLHLSAAPPTTQRRVRGEPVALGPALSVPLPFDFNGGYLDEMIYSLQMYGGITTVDGQGGIAGRMHVHSGQIDQIPCELIYPWWGEDWTPAWPHICYVVFGGVPLRCPPESEEFSNLFQPFKWQVDGNPEDGIAAGGGGAAPIPNGSEVCFGAVNMDPEGQEWRPHLCAVVGSPGNSYAVDAFGVHLVPPGQGLRMSSQHKGVGCPSCGPTLDPAASGSMVFANTWITCFGCSNGYNHASHKFTCLRPGDVVTVSFDWVREMTYNYRFPNGFDAIGPGGFCGFTGALTLGSYQTMLDAWSEPNHWSFGTGFDGGLRPATMQGTMSGHVEHTFSAVPSTHESLFNNVCYLHFGYEANWRSPWSVVRIVNLEIIVQPAGGDQIHYSYVPDEFDVNGQFYWGTNPRPFPPRFLVSVIPTGVSGAGVLHGANIADAIYEVLTNKTWGMGKDPTIGTGVNMTNFQEAAERFAEEGLQVSMVSSGYKPAGDLLLDLCTAGNCILYQNRETGQWEIKLVRPDYDASLLTIVDVSNSDEFEMEMPHAFKLASQVQVRFRRWKPSLPGEILDEYELPGLPYAPGVAYQLPGAMLKDVVLTQDGNTIDADDYSISSDGVLRFSYRADSVDFDGPEPVLISAIAQQRRPGFEDAVATAINDAVYHAIGHAIPVTLDMPMLMDDVSAQRAAEDALLTNSRPLKSMRWYWKRVDPSIHPGSVVKLNYPEKKIEGLVTRILRVTERKDPDGGFLIEAIEEKYGFRTDALIFHPYPERPPIDFPGDDPVSSGTAPQPAGFAQITPSDVRLALFSGAEGFDFELARTRVDSFYVGDPTEFGPDGCAADEEPVYFVIDGTETIYDDTTAPDDGCPVYYWLRHVKSGYQPSAWIGPILAVIDDTGTPADSQAEVAPTIALEEFEDAQNEIGYTLLWVRDPQNRIRRVSYKIRNPGEDWGTEQFPPRGNGLFEGYQWLNVEGWKHYSVSVFLRMDDREIEVQWSIEHQWSDGIVVDTLTTVFPLYLEPVWDEDGQLVTTELGEVVTASRLHDVEFAPTLVTDGGVTIVNDGGQIVTG